MYTYIMKNSVGLIKVGYSNNPTRRRIELENASGLTVTLEHSVKGQQFESLLHKELDAYRQSGEWFNCTLNQALDALDKVQKEEVAREEALAKKLEAQKEVHSQRDPNLEGITLSGPFLLDKTTATKADLKNHTSKKLEELIAVAGRPIDLARMLKVTPVTVNNWRQSGQISKKAAKAVAAHDKLGQYFTAVDLRPDMEW